MEVLGGVQLTEVEVPSEMRGKTLLEADIRRCHGVEVVLIHTAETKDGCMDGRPAKIPTPDVVLEPGDRLLVIGSLESIEKLRG